MEMVALFSGCIDVTFGEKAPFLASRVPICKPPVDSTSSPFPSKEFTFFFQLVTVDGNVGCAAVKNNPKSR